MAPRPLPWERELQGSPVLAGPALGASSHCMERGDLGSCRQASSGVSHLATASLCKGI